MQDTFYTDPKAEAEKYGINVKPYETYVDDSVCGEIRKEENGDITIKYNPMHHENRQRFTIAHELGHYLLGHLDSSEKKYRNDTMKNFAVYGFDADEVDANNFAAELLMPKEKIDFLLYKKGISDIDEMAKILKVSPAALTYRLKNMGYIS